LIHGFPYRGGNITELLLKMINNYTN